MPEDSSAGSSDDQKRMVVIPGQAKLRVGPGKKQPE